MQLPEHIRTAAEEHAAGFDRKELMAAAASISAVYRAGKADGSVIAGKPAECAAYAAVRMPATFAAVSTALEHALTHYHGKIRSAADTGAGTGAAACAVSELTDVSELHCYERESEMRKLGEKLTGHDWFPLDITRESLPRSYDLITAAYVLNELTEADRARVIAGLWEKTDGMLLIVEPGTMKGYANILQARKLLTGAGAKIAFPCPEISECPLPEGDWCHFTARAARSKLHKQLKGGDVPYEDEKFSCIAAVRGEASPCKGRILRHPQISSGFVELHLCTADGISDIKVTKKSPQFKAARKADSGDDI